MKKKILSITLILMLIMTNIVVAADPDGDPYTRENGSSIKAKAQQIEGAPSISSIYNAHSNGVERSDIDICNFGTTTPKQNIEERGKSYEAAEVYNKTDDNWFISQKSIDNNTSNYLFYSLKIGNEPTKYEDIASFVFKRGITYNGKTYDVRIDLEEVNKKGTGGEIFVFEIGKRPYSDTDIFDESTYTQPINPTIGMGQDLTGATIEAKIKYVILDETGNEVNISGVFGITDIDLNQGVAIEDFLVSETENKNVYMHEETMQETDTQYDIKYKTVNTNDTFIYANTDKNLHTDTYPSISDVYALITNKGHLGLTFTFDGLQAYSNILFQNNIITRKYSVTFLPNGGTTEGLDPQEVDDGEQATKPTDPTKPGNTFEGWKKTGEDNYYDFTTPVNEDITLEAIWTPEEYTITYHLDGGVEPSPSNPTTYTYGNEFTFRQPTKEGYNFLGWYEDESFEHEKTGITSTDTGNKNIYAKWQAQEPDPGPTPTTATYKVEHYKETDEGTYEIDTNATQTLNGEKGATVTATPKQFTGYKENTVYTDRVPTGIIPDEGQLVLKLYYDKEKYTVTFDTKDGKPVPENQTVKYNDKATKPTDPKKDGYEFLYWTYENSEGKEAQYNFDDPITKDTKLTAKWKEISEEEEEPSDKDDEDDYDYDGKEIPGGKIDPTTSGTVLPDTGKVTTILIATVIIIAIALGIRYKKLKNMMK